VHVAGEVQLVRSLDWSPFKVWGPLVLSCVVGLGMSHASFVLRSTLSATSATVVGICCKVATVVINCLIWENHASANGIMMLSIW
jgi:solute carrier family 35